MLRLVGKTVPEQLILHEDVSIALPEFRADQMLMVTDHSRATRWSVHFEFQTCPDQSVLVGWCYKNAALNRQLRVPVYLVAVYLERGDRVTFPDHCSNQDDALRNS